MDVLNDTQIEEQVSIYENKIKSIKENIRNELQVRRDLKAKIEEAKKKETTQVLILERLNEYEKIVLKQLEMSQKMEDSDSLKQSAVIEKYNSMLREQQQIWAKYEEEYEKLPLAVEKQKAEIRLLQVNIKKKLIDYRIQETKRIIRMKAEIEKRREQLKIIEFAKLYVEHKTRERRFCELANKVRNLKIRERELILEVQNKERQANEKAKLNILVKKTSITPQLPKIDLSHFIIPTNRDDYLADTISINSYMLEQEYMITNDDHQVNKSSVVEQLTEPATSQPSNENRDTHDSNVAPMELDNFVELRVSSKHLDKSPKMHNSEPINNIDGDRRLDYSPAANRYRSNEELVKKSQPNQSLKIHKVERLNERNRKLDFSPRAADRFNSEEMQIQANQSNQSMNAHASKRNSEQNQRMSFSPYLNASSREELMQSAYANPLHQSSKIRNNERLNDNDKKTNSNQYINKSNTENQTESKQSELKMTSQNQSNQQQTSKTDAAVPDFGNLVSDVPPVKIMKLSLQEQQQQQQQRSPRMNLVSSKFNRDLSGLPQSNTPRVVSCEPVKFPSLQIQPQGHKSTIKEDAFMMNVESMRNISPMMKDNANRSELPPTRSPSLNLIDPNIYGGDTISAILGSEITEPGGSFELARRLYEDSDLNSEDGNFDYEKMLGKFCSPIAARTPQLLTEGQQQSLNVNKPTPLNSNDAAKRNSEKNEVNFVFGQFGKKQTNSNSQRFF